MELSGSLSVWSRRVVVAVGLAAVASAASVVALNADRTAPSTLPGSTQDKPDPMAFQADTMLVYFYVDPAKTAEFEMTLNQVKQALQKSEEPERRQQANGWRVMKVDEPQDGSVLYISVLDPVAKGASYDLFKILGEAMPYDDVMAIYNKLGQTAIKRISPVPVTNFTSMGGGMN